ncbi:hypothetical protein BaRGS_00026887, partial [Batillaria attramentaria]
MGPDSTTGHPINPQTAFPPETDSRQKWRDEGTLDSHDAQKRLWNWAIRGQLDAQ